MTPTAARDARASAGSAAMKGDGTADGRAGRAGDGGQRSGEGEDAAVAGDLRRVVAAIRTSGDLERMGVLARHVAESAVRRGAPCAVPDRVRPAFAEMGRVAVALAHKAAEVVRTGNVIMAIELSR